MDNILTDSQFRQAFPLLSREQRILYLPYLNLAMARFNINSERRVAMFLAHLAVESAGLTKWRENLNYSSAAMMRAWSRRFPTVQSTLPFVKNPKALALKVYAGRMGNRAGTPDGWAYIGRCPIQITGRAMYEKVTAFLGAQFGVDFVANPDLLLKPEFGFLAAAWLFAVEKKCLPLADANKIVASTEAINGGHNGLAERKTNYERNLRILPDAFRLKSFALLRSEFGRDGLLNTEQLEAEHHSLESSDFDTRFQPVEPETGGYVEPETGGYVEPETGGDTEENYSGAPEYSEAGGAENSDDKSGDGKKTEVSVTDGDVKVKTSEGGAPPKVVVVEKPQPKNFLALQWEKIKKATGLNIGFEVLQSVMTKLQDYYSWLHDIGITADLFIRIGYIVAAATIIYFVVQLFHHWQEIRKDRAITDTLVHANSTPENTVLLMGAEEIEKLDVKKYTIVRR